MTTNPLIINTDRFLELRRPEILAAEPWARSHWKKRARGEARMCQGCLYGQHCGSAACNCLCGGKRGECDRCHV